MFDRFTDRARKVMALARKEAQRFHHDFIGTEHILLGLIQVGSGVAANVLKNLGVEIKKIRSEIEKNVQSGPSVVTLGQVPFTPRAKKVLELSMEEANQLGHNYIGTEHLLLGLLRENDAVAAQVLLDLGLKLDEVRNEVLELLGAEMQQGRNPFQEEQPGRGRSRTVSGVRTVEVMDHQGIVVGTVALSREQSVSVRFGAAFGRAIAWIVFSDGKPFSSVLYSPDRGWRVVFKDQKGDVLGTHPESPNPDAGSR